MVNTQALKVVPEPQRERIRSLMATKGVYTAAKLIGCGKSTLDRAIGGLGVLPGTVALIQVKLAERDAAGKDP